MNTDNIRSSLESVYEIVKTIVFVLIMAFILRYFVFQPFVVDGSSMEPNFHNQQYLIVDKITYHVGEPQRGDVVIFEAPDLPGVDYIKRIIGLSGEQVRISNNKIYIDGKELDEGYLPDNFITNVSADEALTLERKLGLGEYFVMGDNREHSRDSREIGAIKKSSIVGRAWFVLYPLEYWGKVLRPGY